MGSEYVCNVSQQWKILQSNLGLLYFIRRGSRSIYIYLYIFTGSSLKMNRSFRRRFALLGACCKYIIYIPLYILVLLFTHIHTGCFLRVLIKKIGVSNRFYPVWFVQRSFILDFISINYNSFARDI